MDINIESNPNYAGNEQFVFAELDISRPICSIRVIDRGKETFCDVIGVEDGGAFSQAHVVKIADSGAGFAFLIYGGAWGIRIRPQAFSSEAWSLANKNQWGEGFKIYGEEEDLVFGEATQ